MNNLDKIKFINCNSKITGPAFYRGEFELDNIADTFIKRPGIKGFIVVNGFNLGRYWDKGPTNTLYLPGPVLKKGKNEIIVFEQEQLYSDTIEFTDIHDLGELETLVAKDC
jgi:beta-galactosidase